MGDYNPVDLVTVMTSMPGDHIVGLEYQEGMGWMRKPESGGGPARKAFGQAPTEQGRCRKRWWSWPAPPPRDRKQNPAERRHSIWEPEKRVGEV